MTEEERNRLAALEFKVATLLDLLQRLAAQTMPPREYSWDYQQLRHQIKEDL